MHYVGDEDRATEDTDGRGDRLLLKTAAVREAEEQVSHRSACIVMRRCLLSSQNARLLLRRQNKSMSPDYPIPSPREKQVANSVFTVNESDQKRSEPASSESTIAGEGESSCLVFDLGTACIFALAAFVRTTVRVSLTRSSHHRPSFSIYIPRPWSPTTATFDLIKVKGLQVRIQRERDRLEAVRFERDATRTDCQVIMKGTHSGRRDEVRGG